MSEIVKSLTLPVAMISGLVFSRFFAAFGPATPYLIFVMLFVTFCRIDISQMKLRPLHFWLLGIQLLGGIGVYLALAAIDHTLAQGVMICILAPTATSAVVIAGMLGANIATMATYTLLSNLSVAVVAPAVFSLIGSHVDMPFIDSFLIILKRVAPILVLPFAGAYLLKFAARKVYDTIGRYQIISFYVWAFSLMVVSGLTVEFIKAQDSVNYSIEIWIAVGALVGCLAQFLAGRFVGKRYGDVVAGGQSLGQKNTVLAIWMAQAYLDPVSSIGPSSYVLWQNLVNSWQLWHKRRLSSNAEGDR